MVLNFTLSDLKGLAGGPVAAQSSKGVWEMYLFMIMFSSDITNVFWWQFLYLNEKPDCLIVHLQEPIALILPWSRNTKITLLFAILFWTRFGTYNNNTIDCHFLLDKNWDSPDVTINAPICKVMVGLVQESHNFLPVFAAISLFMQVSEFCQVCHQNHTVQNAKTAHLLAPFNLIQVNRSLIILLPHLFHPIFNLLSPHLLNLESPVPPTAELSHPIRRRVVVTDVRNKGLQVFSFRKFWKYNGNREAEGWHCFSYILISFR